MRQKATLCVVFFAVLGLAAANASAELLGTGLSYNGIEGSKTFNKTSGTSTLAGVFSWAVFTAENFTLAFPGCGYSPTSNELVYTYQIENTGNLNISLSQLALISHPPADHAGYFTVENAAAEQAPYQCDIISDKVVWDFQGAYNIPHPGISRGLAVCSPRTPRSDWDIIFDGGLSVIVTGIPGPGTANIPEPSTLAMLFVAAVIGGTAALRRQRKQNV